MKNHESEMMNMTNEDTRGIVARHAELCTVM